MAARWKPQGLLLYNLLRKEVYAANKKSSHPLTHKQVERLIHNKVFPEYRGQSPYSIRKADLRPALASIVKKATRKKNYGSIVYGKLLHQVTEFNKRIAEHQQLTIDERRKLVSNTLFPLYKNLRPAQLNWEEINKKITAEIRKLKLDICDVLAIPENLYQKINYFEIDDFIARILPPCVFVAVNAGGFGQTDIFNTKNYNYYDSGVKSITDKINRAIQTRQIPVETDKIPKYFGEIMLRPGKKNDGHPENYYLEMILVINDVAVEEPEPIKIPRHPKTTKAQKAQKQTRKYIDERLKKFKAEKSKVKPIRQRVSQLIFDIKAEKRAVNRLVKRGNFTKKMAAQWQESYFKDEKKKLDAYRKKNILTIYQYKELLEQLREAFK